MRPGTSEVPAHFDHPYYLLTRLFLTHLVAKQMELCIHATIYGSGH